MEVTPIVACHLLAMPYPARGHINSLLNFCKLLVINNTHILVTFVLTEEWLHFIGSDNPAPANLRFTTISNVIPSELVRGADQVTFMEAIMTNMEAPFEQLLDRLEPPPTIIVHDSLLFWVVGVGNRRNVTLALFWTMSASIFSVLHHHHLLEQNSHYPVNFSENGDKRVDYIPGIPPSRLADFPLNDESLRTRRLMELAREGITWTPKAQYLLFASVYELEPQAIDVLKADLSLPIYTIGPTIPCFDAGEKTKLNIDTTTASHSYLQWLDNQPKNSVLYISQGSHFSVAKGQVDEIASGLRECGVRFLWIARREASRLKEICGEKGLVVEWCEQLKVLRHPAIGGFWTHCGWNSIKEGILTLPIMMDQGLDSAMIVEWWKVGWRVKDDVQANRVVKKDEVAGLLKKFIDMESYEGREMRKRAKELQHTFRRAIADGGSGQNDFNAFVRDITNTAK
ncbi:UDP-glycosyltransferase 87A1-like [Prosopis cineraria]|uniref:UDP-glycosyltransferase 87A1-like n=1 Tax=Prosopis cineraria TaxID=364024 RepID=UPI0024100341|nr:UDP-glycosyltransferase 87A1-like [Prosopis cineraria]